MVSALLFAHCILTPILIGMIPINCVWCFIFAFLSVFTFCALNLIAQEIENPFGDDANDLHCDQAQANMNEALLLLLSMRQRRYQISHRKTSPRSDQPRR